MGEEVGRVSRLVESYRSEIIKTMVEMIPIRAISPMAGGKGESERADFLEKKLRKWGFKTSRYDYKDNTGTIRPNIVSRTGSPKRALWIVGHMDTVSEGDRSLWKTDPFKAYVKDGRIYGRGTEDDGQGSIAGMFAMKVLKESGLDLKYGIGVALVADEELGSKYGICKLLDEGIFRKDDLFVVPDRGCKDGSEIEIAEKGGLWIKMTITGKQVHASTPDKGENAYRHSIRLLGEIDRVLHKKYNASNSLFEPGTSTFEMTKHEKNVDSINIIPGVEVCYMDCRILPQYRINDVLNEIKKVGLAKEFRSVKIKIEVANRHDPAPVIDKNCEIVRLLGEKIYKLRGIKPKVVGIGGGTCAAFIRRRGMQAAVWCTEDNVAHEPNEYAVINNIVDDAKVFALMPSE